MDVTDVNMGPIEKSSNDLRNVPTGLFLSWKRSSLLIRIVKELLQEQFNTVAVKGPRQQNDTCEIFLQSFNSSPAYFDGSKELLQSYLHLVEEPQPGTLIEKEPVVVVDLADDDEPSYIVLDQSVHDDETPLTTLDKTLDKSVIIIDLENSKLPESEKQKKHNDLSVCGIENANRPDITRKFPTEEVIIIDTQEEKSSPTLNFPHREFQQQTLPKSTFQESKQNRTKRKRHLEPVVEILDDDVILIDEFPSVPRTNSDTNSHISNNKENVSNLRVTLNGDNRIISRESATKAVTENTTALIEIDDDDILVSSGPSKSQFYVPPKKVSKFAYKRTAHLMESLTRGTTSNSPETTSDSNIFNPNANSVEKRTGLRPIVIDGNNVAISHGEFSLKRLQICINYFEKRGHRQIKAFLPHHRINRVTYEALNLMERQGTLVFTPSRKVNGKRVASYDDRFIVQYATETGGVIVTTDNYRDLLQENPSWKETIEQRILMFSWVDDVLMFPQDPMGRHGPTLNQFLQFPS